MPRLASAGKPSYNRDALATPAIDASDASLWRREPSPLGERLRQLPAHPAPATTPEAARSAGRDQRTEAPGYEVLDFRRQDDEASRYRRARDASAGPAEAYSRYAPNSEAARFVVEVRVAVAASAEAASQVSAESEAVSAMGTAAAVEARQAQAAAAAYEALAASRAAAAPTPSERTLAAERDANDYEAARLATLRAQASSAYQAVDRMHDRGRVHVFA